MKKKERFNLKLPLELMKILNAYSDYSGESRTYIIEQALCLYFLLIYLGRSE